MVNIYLSKSRQAAIEASGKTVLELIDLGLEAAAGGKVVDVGTGEGLVHPAASRARPTRDTCPHPPARRAKGLCMACGTHVG